MQEGTEYYRGVPVALPGDPIQVVILPDRSLQCTTRIEIV